MDKKKKKDIRAALSGRPRRHDWMRRKELGLKRRRREGREGGKKETAFAKAAIAAVDCLSVLPVPPSQAAAAAAGRRRVVVSQLG